MLISSSNLTPQRDTLYMQWTFCAAKWCYRYAKYSWQLYSISLQSYDGLLLFLYFNWPSFFTLFPMASMTWYTPTTTDRGYETDIQSVVNRVYTHKTGSSLSKLNHTKHPHKIKTTHSYHYGLTYFSDSSSFIFIVTESDVCLKFTWVHLLQNIVVTVTTNHYWVLCTFSKYSGTSDNGHSQ